MRDSRAIKILENHRHTLNEENYDLLFRWQQQALTYIERFLGKDSKDYFLMDSINLPNIQEREFDMKMKTLKGIMLSNIDQTINTIKDIGIKREYHNLLCRYSDKELIGTAFAIGGAIFGFGFWIAKLTISCPNI